MASASALPAAAQWVEGVLLGTLGTTLAVLAVAWVGLEMLSGHISVRRGLQVVLGCFILFGAPLIAAGLRDAVAGAGLAANPGVYVPEPIAPLRPAPAFDPYAGASVRGVEVKPG